MCKNGHDKGVFGAYAKGGCKECKREASRKFREARKAGTPVDTRWSHARTDLGYTETLGGAQ
jgi:hypothetical protein